MAGQPRIDERAVVHPDARIGDGSYIGPFCVIGPDVSMGVNCQLESHVSVQGPTDLGPDNVISPMASIGGAPQDLKYCGEPTSLIVGKGNRIHE